MWVCQHCGEEVEQDWDRCWNCTQLRDSAQAEPQDEEAAPAQHQQCLNCGSKKIIPDFLLRTVFYSRNNQTHVQLSEKQGQRFLSDNQLELRGDVCGACGHVHLRIQNPEFLWQVYQHMLSLEQKGRD